MRGALRWWIVAAFAVAVGHLAWRALFVPPLEQGTLVGGEVTALAGPDAGEKQLYLRRLLHLSQRPRAAWLQVLGRDRLRLYVNGKLVDQQVHDGFPVAIVADLTPHLGVGPNVVAVAARQTSKEHPPVVAVDGTYTL